MPTARVQLPDGRIARFEVPEGTSPQQVLTHAENYFGRGVTKTPDFGPESIKESMSKAGEEMGFGKAVIGGLGTRLLDADARIRQLLGQTLTPQDEQAIRAGRTATGPVSAGRLAGDVLLGSTAIPANLPAAIAAGGAQAALTEPVLPGESTLTNVGRGAVGGGFGYGAAKLLQGMARPITPSLNVQKLLDEGIVPTVGESAASTGTLAGRMVGRAEEAAMSVPGPGDIIGGARRRASITELGRAALARATPRGVEPTKNIGRAGLDETYGKISDVYDEALNKIGVVRPDQVFFNDVSRRVGQSTVGLSQDQVRTVQEAIRRTIAGRNTPITNGYTADIAKQVDSELGTLIRNYQGSDTTRMLAEPVRSAQMAWRDLIRRNAPDQATRDMLDDANRAFANYVRVERAANNPGAVQGEFNQTQLAQAVRETAGGGSRKATYARGNALMEDLSDPAKAVLSSNLGESGTVPRALLAAGLLGGGAYGSDQAGLPSPVTYGLGAMALSPLLYSRAASRYAVGDLLPFNVQNSLAQLLQATAPYASLVGRSDEVRPGEKR